MITITEEIIINADIQKVWSFLTDLEISLNVNSFHQEVILPTKFSLTEENKTFKIIHNFGLGNVDMDVEVINYNPLRLMELLKKNNDGAHKAFEHSSKYELSQNKELTTLKYSVNGSFNFKIQNIPFKPILVKIMQNELINIKNMIESSETIPQNMGSKITTT